MEDPRITRVRAMIDAWNSRDWGPFFEWLADDLEVHPDPLWPEPGPYVGAAARGFLRSWIEAWDSLQIEAESVDVVGDCIVLWGAWHGEGLASGADVQLGIGLAITFDERLCATRMYARFDREQAFEIARATASPD